MTPFLLFLLLSTAVPLLFSFLPMLAAEASAGLDYAEAPAPMGEAEEALPSPPPPAIPSSFSVPGSPCPPALFNPCAGGRCIITDSNWNYMCICTNTLWGSWVLTPDDRVTCAPAEKCAFAVTTFEGTDCRFWVERFKDMKISKLESLNPGLNCSFGGGALPAGIQLCMQTGEAVATSIEYTNIKRTAVGQGDSCQSIMAAAQIPEFVFFILNPGIQCQFPYLFVSQTVAIGGDPVSFPNSTVVSNTASCGCMPGTTVCADGISYQSMCDALCNFATSIHIGACTCAQQCVSRWGLPTVASPACVGGVVCPYPSWSPGGDLPTARAKYPGNKYPLCKFYNGLCIDGCSLLRKRVLYETHNRIAAYAGFNKCFSECFGCAMKPCFGPPTTVLVGIWPCVDPVTPGCTTPRGNMATTICSYWNRVRNPQWTPL